MPNLATDRFVDDPLVSENVDADTLTRLEHLWATRLREASTALAEQSATINELEAAIAACNEDEKAIFSEFETILEKPFEESPAAGGAARSKRAPQAASRPGGPSSPPAAERNPHQAAILDILRPFLMLDRAVDRATEGRIPNFERATDPIAVPPIARPRGIDTAVFSRLLALRQRRVTADVTRARLRQRLAKACAVRDEKHDYEEATQEADIEKAGKK